MKHLLLSILLIFYFHTNAEQVPDMEVDVHIENLVYSGNYTARIGIDASHNNLHTLEGGFAPFAKLLEVYNKTEND